jgi:hypothetical protein
MSDGVGAHPNVRAVELPRIVGPAFSHLAITAERYDQPIYRREIALKELEANRWLPPAEVTIGGVLLTVVSGVGRA